VSAPDVRPAYAVEIVSAMLSPAEYAKRHEMGFRTVQRYLPLGRIEGAVQGEDGRWRIPADARVLDASATTVVRQAASEVIPPAADVRLASVLDTLPALLDVATAARLLGISPYTVRQHADELGALRWGRSLRIPQATIRRLAGI
jgi:hypothetical protein